MGRYIVLLLCAFLFFSTAYSQSHGLQFASHEVVPEKRTSLNLTPGDPICFTNTTELSFDISFRPNQETYFGFVLRMISADNQNIDVVYNQKLLQFNFVIGETFSFPFTIDSASLYGKWNNMKIRVNKKDNSIAFLLNGKEICRKDDAFKNELCCRIYFGLNDRVGFQTRDIPPMRIKDIVIVENDKQKYAYPLAESNGDVTANLISGEKIPVKNPSWIKPRHQQWEEVLSVTTGSTPSFAFSSKDEKLYIAGTDSIYTYSLKNFSVKSRAVNNNATRMPAGNQAIVNPLNNRLYNFDIDEKIVREYDTAGGDWSKKFSRVTLTEFWQANKFISPVDTCLYIVAGYGQLQYKNMIQRYHFSTGLWDTVKPAGDFFMPRYLAALGMNQTGDTAYIIGGYGSNTGDQTINPRHTYDIIAYSVRNKTFKLLTHLKNPAKQFCFTNSLIIEQGTDHYYALTYPNDRFNSSLQLIRGKLHSDQYELMADSIPYLFYDIESFADLYYDSLSKKLIAVTLHMQKNNTTVVKAYTLDFPPNPVETVVASAATPGGKAWLYISAGIVVLAGLVWVYRQRKKNNTTSLTGTMPVAPVAMQEAPAEHPAHPPYKEFSSVFLFGQFEVFDKDGHDITHLFSPLLKEIFLLVLIHTYKDGKGITSEKLFETIWSDKSTKDARNNYSVNSVKLKPILEKIGDCHIERDSGKLRLEIQDNVVAIDYQRFMELVVQQPVSRTNIAELVHLLQRGSFLGQLHYNWLDDIKSEVSELIVDTLLQYLATAGIETDAEFIIKISNAIFLSDQLNEEALAYKCRSLIFLGRHGLAKDAYTRFAKEYHETYGQDFEKTFAQLTGNG
ncbi:MAG: hypothetical protein KF862_21665 [Chitinophagaceae bacterium]|nr:hypothetical protein [Chitinophagaceae bacterium]